MLLIVGTGSLLILMGRIVFMQAEMVADPQMVRASQTFHNEGLLSDHRKGFRTTNPVRIGLDG